MAKKKLSDIKYAPSPTIIDNKSFWHQWCCDCNLRHTFFFNIVRGKTPKADKIEMYIDRDDWATDAMRTLTSS